MSSYKTSNETTSGPELKDLYFINDSARFFRTTVDSYGKNLSGLLIAKKVNDDTLRVTFMSDMGLKFFDLEIYKGSYKLINCIPQLKSEAVMNTLVGDMSTFLLWPYQERKSPVLVLSPVKEEQSVVRYEYGSDYLFYAFHANDQLGKITYAYGKRYKKKYEVTYTAYENTIPEHVVIKHTKFKLKIELDLIKR
jgi:hypothetical protein